MTLLNVKALNKSFYEQTTLDLAQSLLGKILVKETSEGIASGIIVETEGYLGFSDEACHSYGHRRTKRTEVMYGPPGHAYTYVMHCHCLMNIVSGPIDVPEAVLIRALEPQQGIELMQKRRGEQKKLTDLTSGPGKLSQAMGIDKSDYGKPLFLERDGGIQKDNEYSHAQGHKSSKDKEAAEEKSWIYILEGITPTSIAAGPRIGIENYGKAKEYPWRFWIPDNPFVSRRSKKAK
ncbi:DNA-3-methyladenine glycosylase [Heliorestis convoluta]|uniref:DNA-3-methyladenine glycosylase n=1 Tax=Heliorestis convoluta TaxID=356322 RepID=UPI001FA94ADA|nr:DNA-3-methyladenine glycosylase [Heliorestis convoluta]